MNTTPDSYYLGSQSFSLSDQPSKDKLIQTKKGVTHNLGDGKIGMTPFTSLLKKRFHKSNKPIPAELSKRKVKEFILREALALRDDTHAKFTTENPIRSPHDEEVEKRKILESYFRENYDQCIQRKQIPLLLLDSKEVLLRFRKYVSSNHKISFSDSEILQEYRAKELPEDLREMMREILSTFK